MTRSMLTLHTSRLVAVVLLFAMGVPGAYAQTLTLEQVLAQVKQNHPNPRIAAMQVEKARLGLTKVDGMMDWQLGASAGYSHDLNFLSQIVDTNQYGLSLGKQFAHGGTLSLNTSVSEQDTDSATPATLIPDPLTSTDIMLNYRLPLAQGRGNPEYAQGQRSAQAGLILSEASERAMNNAIASQVMEIYFAMALTQARRESLDEAIVRARRFQQYIVDNRKLGLAEEGDALQAESQLRAQLAERNSLQVAWEQQRTILNRLMGRPWNEEITIASRQKQSIVAAQQQIIDEAKQSDPQLAINQARLELAEAEVERTRDKRGSRLDLVMAVGQRQRDGDTAAGPFNESGTAGSIKLEYSRALGNHAFDAGFYQAQVDRRIAMENITLATQDVEYNVASLLSQMDKTREALSTYEQRLNIEQSKLKEAKSRYRSGRSTTAEILQYESDLSLTKLAVEQKQIELNKQFYQLTLMRGRLWQQVAGEKERS